MRAVEADTCSPEDSIFPQLGNGTPQEIAYPVMRLHEAGLLAGQDKSVLSDLYPMWRPKPLTYQGQEFLKTVRGTEAWRRTKAERMITVQSRNDLAPRNPRIFFGLVRRTQTSDEIDNRLPGARPFFDYPCAGFDDL